jgi:uncharacterized protein DUF4384
MPSALLLPFVLAVQVASTDDPALRLSVSPHTIWHYGEQVRVTVQPERDGFLLVLRVDTDGEVHPLFPLDADDDGFVRAGEALHLGGRPGNEAFVSFERDGRGTVFAALSEGRWSYSLMDFRNVGTDQVASLLELVESMAGDNRYEYEVATYWVSARAFGYNSGRYGSCYGFAGRSYAFGRFSDRFRFRQRDLFYGRHPFYFNAYSHPFSPVWFGYDAYDPWCYGRYGPGFWSSGPRTVVIGGPGFPGRLVDRTGLKKKKGDIVKSIEPRRRQPGTDVATDRPVVARPVKERAKPGVDTPVARERARPAGDRGVVREPMPHTPNRDAPRAKPSVERPQPIRPERPSTPPPAIQKPVERPAERPKN